MATHPSNRPSHPADVPLAVWPVAQTSAQYQRAGRYLPACSAHPGKMLPALAARIVAEYSTPGQLVVDPMAGIGTTVVEAALLHRRAVGIELEARWATLADANLDQLLDRRQRRLAQIRVGDAARLPDLLGTHTGRVDLVVVSPPYGCDAGVIDKPGWIAGRRLCPTDSLNYAPNRANVGHVRGPGYSTAMADIYTACFHVLRPGGLLVTITKNTRRRGRCFDLAGTTVALARQTGFDYLQHVVALHASIRDGQLRARPSFWQFTQLRHAHDRGDPAHLVVHEDVCVFAKPAVTR
jgi:modification methylase